MMPSNMYKQPVALDRDKHRNLRINATNDYGFMRGMNSVFVTVGEFVEVMKDYPIVFIPAGTDEATGAQQVAPVAALGLSNGENLFVRADGSWAADYVPAFIRRYPFGMGQIDKDTMAVCIDEAHTGFSQTQGDRLMEEDGSPTKWLKDMHQFLENYERDVENTRVFCRELQKLELLQTMRFDATMPGGEQVTVDGFLAINVEKFNQLPDAKILEMHRNGMLGLIHLQQASVSSMRRLAQRRAIARAN